MKDKQIKKERISIPPNNQKLWRYMTEGLSGRAKADTLPSLLPTKKIVEKKLMSWKIEEVWEKNN